MFGASAVSCSTWFAASAASGSCQCTTWPVFWRCRTTEDAVRFSREGVFGCVGCERVVRECVCVPRTTLHCTAQPVANQWAVAREHTSVIVFPSRVCYSWVPMDPQAGCESMDDCAAFAAEVMVHPVVARQEAALQDLLSKMLMVSPRRRISAVRSMCTRCAF